MLRAVRNAPLPRHWTLGLRLRHCVSTGGPTSSRTCCGIGLAVPQYAPPGLSSVEQTKERRRQKSVAEPWSENGRTDLFPFPGVGRDLLGRHSRAPTTVRSNDLWKSPPRSCSKRPAVILEKIHESSMTGMETRNSHGADEPNIPFKDMEIIRQDIRLYVNGCHPGN